MINQRKAQFPIAEVIINRWSARAMSGESIDDQQLMSLFEAARWAPSSYNGQPWRFIYAKQGTPAWQSFFDLLVPFNQSWCKKASVLVVVVSRLNFEYNNAPSLTHSFDTGAACQNLALQGSLLGLVVHGMEGFDYEKAKQLLRVPVDYAVEAMFALGKPGNLDELPEDLRKREVPSDRKKVQELVSEGIFKEGL